MSDYDTIPAALRERDQWLYWNASNDTPRAPLDSPTASYGCSWSDPETWLSFDEVTEGAALADDAGIGFVNAIDNDDHPRGLIGSIDIDGVVDADGHPKDWLPSLEPFFDHDAYVEYSPSGEGLRIPIIGLDTPSWWADCHFSPEEHQGVEVLTNKFSTYTGDQLRGASDTPAEYGEWLDEWLREVYKVVEGDDPLADGDGDDATAYAPDDEWLTEDAAEDALDEVSPDVEYATWRDIGMALVNHFGRGRGGSLFKQWSRGGAKWDSKAKDQADRIIEDAGNYGYDAATLVYHAASHGWDASAAAREYGDSRRSDGGAVTAAPATSETTTQRSFRDRVTNAIGEFHDDIIQAKTARHYIAQAFVDEHHFVYPEDEVRGWRSTLYVYDADEGIYEPRGEDFIRRKLEYAAGDFATNTVESEIIGKVERMSVERDSDAFRVAPERLVVGNGILDLHTGELDDYSPHEYHRTKIDVDWRPDAGEPDAIDAFLHDIVADENVDTLYRLVAHTLYKEYIDEKAAILIGSGENGKSVFLDLVEEFLGGYNVAHRELQDFAEDDYALNNLSGRLANLATEIGEQELSDTTAFKKATGRDVIDAQVKYESPITFENHATLMFATNEMPVFGQDNHAIWRRWLYIDFPYTFADDDPDAKDPTPRRVLMRRLTQDRELEALLVRAQQEIQRWYEGEELFADAMAADEVREKMKQAAEPVYAFATTCLEDANDDEEWVEKSVVRAAYRAFADEEDLPRMADNEFGSRLMSLRDLSIESGQKRVDGKRTHVYKRVRLTSRGRQLLGLDEPADGDGQATVDAGGRTAPKPTVLQTLRDLVEENGGDPVPREGIVWAATGDIGKASAEHALDELATQGDVMELDDGYLPT